jgi:hypothetical protein
MGRGGRSITGDRLCKLATPLSMHSRGADDPAGHSGHTILERRLGAVRYVSRSIFAAMMKSLRDKPLTVWVQSVTRTFPQVTVSSG